MTTQTFDIRNFLDRLTPAKGSNRYICPHCDGNNLTIDPKSGKYQCWSGCENKDIREAVSPWVDREKKSARPKQRTEYIYQDRLGNPCVKVTRVDDGEGRKQIFQSSWNGENWQKGLTDAARTNVSIYHRQEVSAAAAEGQPVLMVEGEGVADALWGIGIAATTTLGGAGKYRKYGSGYQQDLDGVENLVLCPDRDEPGGKHMDDVAQDFPDAKWVYAFPSSRLWSDPPKNGGLDLKDWIESGATKDQILAAIGERRNLVPAAKATTSRIPDTVQLTIEQAVEQARIILRECDNEIAANVRLESVRRACGMGDYSWSNNIVKPLKRELEGDRFKLELLGLLQIDDEVERERLIAQLAPKYSMSAGRIEKAMGMMKARTQTPETKVLDLDELFDMEVEGLSWVTTGLPQGETVILAGIPKSGKTLLAVDLAYAVATGEANFLGEATMQGRVLLISTDESAASTRNKLLNRGFRRCDKDSIKVITSWDISQMATLEKILEDFRPNLTIIDSLRRINKGSEISENSAEFADNIYTLKETLSRYGSAGVLIHHLNKSNEAMGVNRLRGSSAIAGATWGVWQIDHLPKPDPNNKKKLIIDPKDPRRVLSVFARDSEGQQLNIELNLENSSWTNLGSGESEEEQAAKLTIRDRVLKVLAANPSPMSGKAIIEALDGAEVAPNSVYNELSDMERKRLIGSKPAPGDKRYRIFSLPKQLQNVNVKSLPPLPPPHSVKNMTNFAESHTQYGSEDSHVDSHVDSHAQTGTSLPEIPETPTQSQTDNSHIFYAGTRGGGVESKNDPPALTKVDNLAQSPEPTPAESPFKKGDRVISTTTKEEAVVLAVTPELIKIRYTQPMIGLTDEAEVKPWQIRRREDE